MRVRELGEFGLIGRIAEITGKKYIGDDAAVLGKSLFSSDMMVDDVHFKREWHPPFKLGRKAMCSNISDMAAMGGLPEYALVSLGIPPETDSDWVLSLYEGMNSALRSFGGEIAGGDTVKSGEIVVSISMLGRAERPVLRSGAMPGDRIFLSGPLGGSTAGLEALKRGLKGFDSAVEKHLDPGCRADIGTEIGEFATSMIDISDGLASEIHHISEMSGVGAILYADRIPVHESVKKMAGILDKDPVDTAISSGEEYELLFTVPEERIDEAAKYGVEIGEITGDRVFLNRDGEKSEIKGGWRHF